MRRGFIRAIWGDISSNGIRDGKLGKDIESIRNNPYAQVENSVVYVFGEENLQNLTQQGFSCKLISNLPIRYDMKTQLYRHKLDILLEATKDFDEMVFLDWDCKPVCPLPSDFWDVLGKKAPFQANLFQYRTKKCLWRKVDWRKVTNGGFLYIRDKGIPQQFVDNYNELMAWALKQKENREKQGKKLRFREECLMFDDEPAFSKWVDNYLGGWKGIDAYWELFEPEFCNLKNKSAFPEILTKSKRECFIHWGPK